MQYVGLLGICSLREHYFTVIACVAFVHPAALFAGVSSDTVSVYVPDLLSVYQNVASDSHSSSDSHSAAQGLAPVNENPCETGGWEPALPYRAL